MIKIVLKGSPLSTQHIYRASCIGNFPRSYMTKAGKDMKEFYQLSTKRQYKGEVLLCPCKMELKLFFKDKRRRDLDNYNKLVFDALEGIVYKDDNQIQELFIIKSIDKENPRVEVDIKFK